MKDNYYETIRRICQIITEKAPPGIAPYYIDQLKAMAASDNPDPLSIYVSFRRESVGANGKELEAALDIAIDGQNVVPDERGDWWMTCRPRVTVSWRSWGSCPAPLALERIALMQEVATFASMLNLLLAEDPIVKLHETKEQREVREEDARRAEYNRKLTEYIAANVRGMRVGDIKPLTFGHDADCSTIRVKIGKREYIVDHGSEAGVDIRVERVV